MANIGKLLNQNIGIEGITVDGIFATWQDGLILKKENREAMVNGLRSPQLGAIHAALAHWEVSNDPATVVMPTGTGKTEVMLSLLIGAPCHRTVIIVPTDALRTQISDKVASLGLLSNPDFELVKNSVLKPIVGIMQHKPQSAQAAIDFVSQCNVIVTTTSIIGGLSKLIQVAIANQCTHLFIDEAHHAPAKSWNEVKKSFKNTNILQFTATPFRNDDKPIGDRIIFNYPLRKAQDEGYFKPITYIPVIEWDESKSDKVIAEKAIERLNVDIARGYDHIIMARVNSIKRAEMVQRIYADSYAEYNPLLIHSGLSQRSINEIKSKVVNGECKILCVNIPSGNLHKGSYTLHS